MQTQTRSEPISVLLIEDDEDDFILTKSLFTEIAGCTFKLEWIKSWRDGLEILCRNQHDICLVDYRLGAETGIDLLRAALERGSQAPIILLTGQGEHEVDLEAMKAGAADYLVKGRLDAGALERSIRYALERRRAAARAAAEQARLAAFGVEVGLAVTRRDDLNSILDRCARAMATYLKAGLARIWILENPESGLRLCASSGTVPGTEKSPREAFAPGLDLARLGRGETILVKHITETSAMPDREWAQRENLVAFAGYPLVLEDRLVGLMGIFAHQPLQEAVLQEMASVANGIALCIERKRSEEALEFSQVKYRSVVENIKEVIFQTDNAGRWVFLNPAWTDITGFDVKETIGTDFADYIHPEDRERHRETFEQVVQWKKSYCRDEVRYLAKDGSFRWIEVYAQPTLNSSGELLGASGTLSDITERKRAEAEIQKLAAFPRYNPDPVMELAADGTLSYLNQAAHEMARALGVTNPEAILPPRAAAVAEECLRSGQSKLADEVQINGRTLSWSFFPIVPSQAVHCYGVDVTERLNLEAQLRHAQKLESVGQLAAGVAHDFNNILTIIQGHTDRLLAQCGEAAPGAEPLKQVSAAARRASSLTQQLLAFSRKQVMQPKVLDLNVVLGNLTKMLHRLLGDDVALESRHAEHLPAIEADTGMVEQIIMNLSVNARDAMPKGGQLLITTSAVEIDASHVQQHSEARPGRFVCLSVTDTGSGMSRQTLGRIFEPFFTTKPVGKGTGLGLATVYGIVKQHQGWVEVMSEVGVGTTFKVFLPATEKCADSTLDKPTDGGDARGGHETILLVEDEPVLRELARVILQDYDYDVIEASTGVEALKVWDEHGGRVDLLLTDMVMPDGISGKELAERLRVRKPGLKVVYTSGYSADVMGREAPIRETRFLQKPYAPPLLAQTVRDCLDLKAA